MCLEIKYYTYICDVNLQQLISKELFKKIIIQYRQLTPIYLFRYRKFFPERFV